MIKVLVVDDSGFMRLAIKKMLENNKSIQIVADACTGEEAVRKAKMYAPDVITMDIEMPDMNGIEATRKIMQECPTAIIMVSSLTKMAADATIKALEQGAVDYISKSSSFVSLDIAEIESELVKKILYWAENFRYSKKNLIRTQGLKQKLPVKPGIAARHISIDIKPDLILVAASTGGPKILPVLFKQISKPTCPVLIALHMPAIYTKSFSEHLKMATGLNVVEGVDGEEIKEDMVVVLPGGIDSEVISTGYRSYALKVVKESRYNIHPSANALFISALKVTKRLAAVVLTGMGDDGLEGAIELNKYGLPVIAQNEESCTVYGMPRSVVEAGVASDCLDVAGIAKKIDLWFGKSKVLKQAEA